MAPVLVVVASGSEGDPHAASAKANELTANQGPS
jgi:hypothetical protein